VALAPGSWPAPLLRLIRGSNKHVLNPVMGRLAGRRFFYAAAIRHTGRKSGRRYSTPVGAEHIPDGFLIPLGYGTDVDWLRNVLAAGCATIESDGRSYAVVRPEVLDAVAAVPMLAPRRRRRYERIGIAHYLKVTRA
jgi:deazaflavin-dependent oxidoreductase (nitroreductase family)